MKYRIVMVAAAFAAALCGQAMAAEPVLNCGDPQAQSEMNMCADRDYRAADAQLNTAYRQLTAKLDDQTKALLVEAQRAWIAFRDKECIYETNENEGGSIHPMVYAGCLTRLTMARTRELKAQASCLDNSETCQ